jgi:hypothetical protein
MGAKSIELRPWTRNNFQNVMVLLHISSNTSFDCFFDQMDFSPEKAPKFSIVGAAILSEIRKYEDAELLSAIDDLIVGSAMRHTNRLLSSMASNRMDM